MRKTFAIMKCFDCLVNFWTFSTVVEFSKGQIDRIFSRSVLRPLYVYLSFNMLQITVLIHEGSTPPLLNRGARTNSSNKTLTNKK